jgi:mRNA-degrading endonuclease RelE of RelBE toxin-antitoxin system
MSFSIRTIASFDKAVKQLRKKYRRIGKDLRQVAVILADDPFSGTPIPGFSHRVWKIRVASVDMQSGKRGGYRVIYAIDRLIRSATSCTSMRRRHRQILQPAR